MTTETETSLRGALEATLPEYVRARDTAIAYGRERDDIGAPIKSWLEQNQGEVLVDGEHGITADLQPRHTSTYDLIGIYKADQATFMRLLELGCLQVNAAALKAQKGQVAIPSQFVAEGVTYSLQVKEAK